MSMGDYHGDEPMIAAANAERQARIDDERADNAPERYAELPPQTVSNAVQVSTLALDMMRMLVGFAQYPLATFLLDADIIVTKARQLRAEVERMNK